MGIETFPNEGISRKKTKPSSYPKYDYLIADHACRKWTPEDSLILAGKDTKSIKDYCENKLGYVMKDNLWTPGCEESCVCCKPTDISGKGQQMKMRSYMIDCNCT